MPDEDFTSHVGWERKPRELLKGPDWHDTLRKLGLSVPQYKELFAFARTNISVQPLVNSEEFLGHDTRLIRTEVTMSPWGYLEVWVYFKIEPDDEACTLLWAIAPTLNVDRF